MLRRLQAKSAWAELRSFTGRSCPGFFSQGNGFVSQWGSPQNGWFPFVAAQKRVLKKDTQVGPIRTCEFVSAGAGHPFDGPAARLQGYLKGLQQGARAHVFHLVSCPSHRRLPIPFSVVKFFFFFFPRKSLLLRPALCDTN